MQNSQFANLPFERGEILFSKGFSVYTDIRKLQDKAKTSYTLSTRRLRFGYEQQFVALFHNGVRGGHIRKGGRAARIRKDIKFNQAVLAVISSAR